MRRHIVDAVGELDGSALPVGAPYLHVDVDVCDPTNVPDLRYPARGGCAMTELLAAVEG